MKTLIKIITIFILTFAIFGVNAEGAIELGSIESAENITKYSLEINDTGSVEDQIKTAGFSILTTIKYIVSALLVMFLVYVGIQMIMSLGTDEDKLSSSKRQIRYSLIGLIFINIPGKLYNIFVTKRGEIDGQIFSTWSSQLSNQEQSVLINTYLFNDTINGGIVTFIETVVFSIAIFIIVIAGLKIIASRGKDEDMTEAKNKIIWSIVGLVFIGFIESWQAFVYNGRIKDGATMFKTIEELGLFFAGPVGIFFLTLAGYYYITSNGDEDKVKKAKNIIINTLLATVILLASHAFLQDLLTLKI